MSESTSVMDDWEAQHQEYLRREAAVLQRLELDLIGLNRDKLLASIAISLKRIADSLGRVPYATGAAGVGPLVISSYTTSTPNYGGGGILGDIGHGGANGGVQ